MSALSRCGAGAALLAGACVAFTQGQSNGVYICRPGQQGTPSVYAANPKTVALLDTGFYPPAAVDGVLPKEDNVGAYHLTCTLDGLVPTGVWVDHNGALYGKPTNALGEYPVEKVG